MPRICVRHTEHLEGRGGIGIKADSIEAPDEGFRTIVAGRARSWKGTNSAATKYGNRSFNGIQELNGLVLLHIPFPNKTKNPRRGKGLSLRTYFVRSYPFA